MVILQDMTQLSGHFAAQINTQHCCNCRFQWAESPTDYQICTPGW